MLEYDAAGAKVQEFGAKGDGPGQFNNAHGIAVVPDGHIYVADRENGRVQWFDLRGTLLGVRTCGGQFYNIVFDRTGEMWAMVKSGLSRYLKRVRSGVRVIVTERGRAIATIGPVDLPADVEWAQALVMSGRARWSGGKPTGSRRET